MTSPSSETSGLRQKGQGTCGCLTVRSSAAARHAAVSGDTAKPGGITTFGHGRDKHYPQGAKEFCNQLNSTNYVLVLDADKRPLTPCRPARARQLLSSGQAAVFHRYPFTIILKKPMREAKVKQFRIKIDPGSKTTGIALVEERSNRVVFAAELEHRGQQIKESLDFRRARRRFRRYRKTRYRQARFINRRRAKGWLPPSLLHRVATTMTWMRRFQRSTNIAAVSMELVRFDTTAIGKPRDLWRRVSERNACRVRGT